jgi:hypothetical protein
VDDSTAAVFEHQLPQIYQTNVFMLGISPMIYWRLLVRSDMSLADLHYAIQCAMGWEGFHLHRFMVHGKTYGNDDANYIVRYDAPEKPTLKDFDFEQAERFLYEYDFISWWQHEVRVEKILPFEEYSDPYPDSVFWRERLMTISSGQRDKVRRVEALPAVSVKRSRPGRSLSLLSSDCPVRQTPCGSVHRMVQHGQ